jgi:hypothetical protein
MIRSVLSILILISLLGCTIAGIVTGEAFFPGTAAVLGLVLFAISLSRLDRGEGRR